MFTDILGFLLSLYNSLVDFSRSMIDVWQSTPASLVESSGVSDVPVLGSIVDLIASIPYFDTITVGGLCLGSVALVVLLTLVRWFRQAL